MKRLLPLLFIPIVGCIDAGTLTVEESVVVIDTQDDAPQTEEPTGSETEQPDSRTSTARTSPPDEQPSSDEPTVTDPSCMEGEDLCEDSCIDVTADDANCGGCGVMCGAGLICMESDCVCEVGDLCEGECVDTTANSEHCGDCGNPCSGGQACVDGACQALTEVEGVLLATNQARAAGQDCGMYGTFDPAPPLDGDPNLHLAAQVHADDMSANNFFSHTGSDDSSFSQRISRTDYSGQPLGENIAAGQQSAQSAVAGWVESDGHCRNLMNPNATKLGVGYALGGPYGTLWVQVFAR